MRLLIPTDFSECAAHAVQMGVNIAKTAGAEIHILHCMNEMSHLQKLNLGKVKSEDLQKHLDRWAREKLETLKSEIRAKGITCESKLIEGQLHENLRVLLDIEEYDMIVMGSHGVSGKEEWFIGSNTSKAVRKLHKNILVVKGPVEELDFSQVVFVTGLNLKERPSFKMFLDFIKPFNVKDIHILSVDTYRNFSEPSLVMREVLQDYKDFADLPNVKTHFYSDYSIQAGIRHFTEEYNIDLIGISNYVRSPLKRIFIGSNVEILVNHSDVPVLSIDYK